MKQVTEKHQIKIEIDHNNLFFAGECGVDAGLIMVGDPCYYLHKTIDADKPYNKLPKEFGKNWDDFCNHIKDLKSAKQFNFDLGHAGLAVLVGNFGGDGCYPVFVEKSPDGQTRRLIVDFALD